MREASLQEAAESGDLVLMTKLKKTLSKQKGGQQRPESLEGKVTEKASWANSVKSLHSCIVLQLLKKRLVD